MATSYPGDVDSFVTRQPDQAMAPQFWNDLQDSVVAIETELGVNPAGSASSVSARLAQTEHPAWAPGCWYTSGPAGGQTTSAQNTTGVWASPIYVPAGATIDQVGLYVRTSGGPAPGVRYGIYSTRSDGLPGSLLASSANSVITAATSGFYTGTMYNLGTLVATPVTLIGGWYWAAVGRQDATSASWEVLDTGAQAIPFGLGARVSAPSTTGVTGTGFLALDSAGATLTLSSGAALPSTFLQNSTPANSVSTAAPRLFLHTI